VSAGGEQSVTRRLADDTLLVFLSDCHIGGDNGRDIFESPDDLAAVQEAFRRAPREIAAVIVEPVAANMGLVLPEDGFLEGLRTQCDADGALLVFDEVITGFRLGRGGAQERFGIRPDLSTFAKVIGGGMPVGAYAGSAALMSQMAPDGPIFQAGTLSGNPVAMAAGRAVVELLGRDGAYAQLTLAAERLATGLEERAREVGIPFSARAIGGLFGFFFHAGPVRNFGDATKADARRFRAFFHAMLDQGIYLAPSPYEAGFVTLAHGQAEIDETLEAAKRAFRKAL